MDTMKGQGLSITTIVVAAIALLVLVVLVAVFTGQIGKTSEGLNSCEAAGGECSVDKPEGTFALDITKNCDDDGEGDKQKCYIPIGN